MQPVTRQRLGEHVPAAAGIHVTEGIVCSLRGPRRGVIKNRIEASRMYKRQIRLLVVGGAP
jgi:hypothetical protein